MNNDIIEEIGRLRERVYLDGGTCPILSQSCLAGAGKGNMEDGLDLPVGGHDSHPEYPE